MTTTDTARTAPPVPGVSRNAGYVVRAVMPGHAAAPGLLASWHVAAEADRGAWVTWEAYDQGGELAYSAGRYFDGPDPAANRGAALRSLARRAGIAVVTPDPGELTADMILAQRAAELLWAVATSENHDIAWSRSPAYRHAELAFTAAVQAAYGCSRLVAQRVRDLLSEYGPHDALQGTTGRGVASYVQAARAWRTRY